jgi:hypothetical protein
MSLNRIIDKAIDSLIEYNHGYDSQSHKNNYQLTEKFENKKKKHSLFNSLFGWSSFDKPTDRVIEAYQNVILAANKEGVVIKEVMRLENAINGLNILKEKRSNCDNKINSIINVLMSWKEGAILKLKSEADSVCKNILECYSEFSELDENEQLVIALDYLNKVQKYCKTELDKKDFLHAFSIKLEQLYSIKAEFRVKSQVYAYMVEYFPTISALITGQRKLNITLSKDKILEIYLKYGGAIQLRELKSDLLVIGCGLGECSPYRCNGCSQIKGGHQDDTVHSSLEMNPSIVSSWGTESQMNIFANRYRVIHDEGSVLFFSDDHNTFWSACFNALKKDTTTVPSTVLLSPHVLKLSPELIPRARMFEYVRDITIRIGRETVPLSEFKLNNLIYNGLNLN